MGEQAVFSNLSTVSCANCEKYPVTSAQFILGPELIEKYLWCDTTEGRLERSDKEVISLLRQGTPCHTTFFNFKKSEARVTGWRLQVVCSPACCTYTRTLKQCPVLGHRRKNHSHSCY